MVMIYIYILDSKNILSSRKTQMARKGGLEK